MYQREMAKVKTAAKVINYEGAALRKIVLDTLKKASDLVGSTLGPNGKVVLIERQENLGPVTTKDGISVFQSMALSNPTAQAILEAARDSSSKTNSEAGDGTTTATILAEALIRNGFDYLADHPHLSPQKIMRELESTFRDQIEPFIKNNALRITNENNDDLLRKVSLIATNNDAEMTDAVLQCFDLVGHSGNVTIAEAPGASGFEVEKIEGFPIARGFEDTCGRFQEEFINDKGNYRIELKSPRFILYNGKLNDMGPLWPIISQLSNAMEMAVQNRDSGFSPNVVIVAHHFSDQVLSALAQNFKDPTSLNIAPLKTYMTQQNNSPYHFLVDLAAFTGATLFDPLTKPLESATVGDLGLPSMSQFESYRYRSIVFGKPDELLVITRSEELEKQAEQAESILDGELLRERVAILTGGIARLKVLGSSEAELKEKRHRVEDAVASIKGALKYGTLPGCAKTLLVLSRIIRKNPNTSDAVKEILGNSFRAPFIRILINGGYNREEILSVYDSMMSQPTSLPWWKKALIGMKLMSPAPAIATSFFYTYDALNFKYGNAVDIGVVDSASAVLMAIKNSLSVAKMLMTLSGTVVFKRDVDSENDSAREFTVEQMAMQDAINKARNEEWDPTF
jgi:chaperonin GroEL